MQLVIKFFYYTLSYIFHWKFNSSPIFLVVLLSISPTHIHTFYNVRGLIEIKILQYCKIYSRVSASFEVGNPYKSIIYKYYTFIGILYLLFHYNTAHKWSNQYIRIYTIHSVPIIIHSNWESNYINLDFFEILLTPVLFRTLKNIYKNHLASLFIYLVFKKNEDIFNC